MAGQICFHEIPGHGCIGNSQMPIFLKDLVVIFMCSIIHRWWGMPTSNHGPVGQNGCHAIGVTRGALRLVRLSNADPLCGGDVLLLVHTVMMCVSVFAMMDWTSINSIQQMAARSSEMLGTYFVARRNSMGKGLQTKCFNLATLSTVLIIMLIALMNIIRPIIAFTLT
jgi:hypothetical protein